MTQLVASLCPHSNYTMESPLLSESRVRPHTSNADRAQTWGIFFFIVAIFAIVVNRVVDTKTGTNVLAMLTLISLLLSSLSFLCIRSSGRFAALLPLLLMIPNASYMYFVIRKQTPPGWTTRMFELFHTIILIFALVIVVITFIVAAFNNPELLGILFEAAANN